MANDDTIASRYIAHGLALIRAANGMARDVDAELVKLGRDIRYLLSQDEISNIGKRALNALLSDINDAIFQRYNAVTDQQSGDLAHLIEIESAFAVKAGDYNNKPSDTALAGILPGLLILGVSLGAIWRKFANDFAYRVNAAIKLAQRVPDANKAALTSIFGQRRTDGQPAGDFATARRNAATLVQTAVHAVSQDARLAAFKANGVQFVEWDGILDGAICPRCLQRHGHLWSIAGAPVDHEIDLSTPPLHFRCRCLLLPSDGQSRGEQIAEQVAQSIRPRFAEWMNSRSGAELDAMLGVGRADLYRRGVITLNDLINQNGRLMSLAELKATIG